MENARGGTQKSFYEVSVNPAKSQIDKLESCGIMHKIGVVV